MVLTFPCGHNNLTSFSCRPILFFSQNCLNIITISFSFATHFKSASSTTSRELQCQLFGACGGQILQHVNSSLNGLSAKSAKIAIQIDEYM